MLRPTIPILSKKVLIVDDNNEVRDTISQYLQIENYLVLQARDGVDALNILEKFTPDIILSDIKMPRMDGIELYKNIRQKHQWLTIPFLFLTADNSPQSIRLGRELGVEDYLTKPISPKELVSAIRGRLLRAAEVEIAHIGLAYLETVKVLANAIEGRDKYTRGHVDRVTKYSLWMAEELSWPSSQIRTLEFGARLHDIGKIIIPDQILNKANKLTDEEWLLMKQHPTAGAKILDGISHLQKSRPYILYHHERWDGSGYPKGLKGRDIPLEARLLAIADVYDALTTSRPYHPARPSLDVLKYLEYYSGKHFDPDLVPIFVKVIENNPSPALQSTI
ncbi:MAG: response regulator [Chloroflexi bacterium]|nr:response regulator [Chloroflexota bacterium]